MHTPGAEQGASYQAQFHQRWNHLSDRHVRALAWLLSAPDLLDWQAPQWHGKIARLPDDPDIGAWLAALDQVPQALYAYLDMRPRMRLGRYAEKLMAFYFRHQGVLVAHSVQVQNGKTATIGEFDFLLRDGAALVHWEFATKFYLLETSGASTSDYFMGPSLADMLSTKMHKILERQLALGQHPAAKIHLPQALSAAQALIKGWLFYRADTVAACSARGLSETHCRGFWCALDELDMLHGDCFALLPRLDWLAPAKLDAADCMDLAVLRDTLSTYFLQNSTPLLVALMTIKDGVALESERGFIVPDDWRSRAHVRIATLEAGADATAAASSD
jgi:uncharacterized protein